MKVENKAELELILKLVSNYKFKEDASFISPNKTKFIVIYDDKNDNEPCITTFYRNNRINRVELFTCINDEDITHLLELLTHEGFVKDEEYRDECFNLAWELLEEIVRKFNEVIGVEVKFIYGGNTINKEIDNLNNIAHRTIKDWEYKNKIEENSAIFKHIVLGEDRSPQFEMTYKTPYGYYDITNHSVKYTGVLNGNK